LCPSWPEIVRRTIEVSEQVRNMGETSINERWKSCETIAVEIDEKLVWAEG
jgi:hypothetical protein